METIVCEIIKCLSQNVILVFVCATLIQLLGILVAYSYLLPPLESIAFRSYINMRGAMNRLENKETINKHDSGFNEIIEFILNDLQKANPSALVHMNRQEELRSHSLNKNDIVSLEFHGIPKSYPGPQVGYLSNSIQVDYIGNEADNFKVYYYKVEEELENKRLYSLFRYAIFFFALGTSVQAVNIIVNNYTIC